MVIVLQSVAQQKVTAAWMHGQRSDCAASVMLPTTEPSDICKL